MEREEEGMNVVVSLVPTNKLPKAPANKMQGLWDLVSLKKEGKEIVSEFDPENKYHIFIRWDREYRERNPEGNRIAGLWHIHGHRSEITLMDYDSKTADLRWNIRFKDGKMIWEGNSDENKGLVRTFERLHEFPN